MFGVNRRACLITGFIIKKVVEELVSMEEK